MKFFMDFLLSFMGSLLALCIVTSVGCSEKNNASEESEDVASSDDANDGSLQQNSDSDANAIYFSDSDQVSFAGGVAGTAKRANAIFEKSALEVVLRPAHCEIVKIDLLNNGKNYLKTLSSGSSPSSNCNTSSSDFIKNARISMEKSLKTDEDIVPFFDSTEGKLYLYMAESTTASSLNAHWIRVYGKKSSKNYVTRNINRGADGTLGAKSSLYFFIRAGLPANATDKSISIDGISIGLGKKALTKEDIAQKIATTDFTSGRIYAIAPYKVSAQDAKVTFEAKFSGDNTNTLVIDDNQYTEESE